MNTPNGTYQKLDRAALWLFFGEFGGMALVVIMLFLFMIGNLILPATFSFYFDFGTTMTIQQIIILIYGLTFIGNLSIGLFGLFIYLRDHHKGYPGIGHLINWLYLASTIWLIFAFTGLVISN